MLHCHLTSETNGSIGGKGSADIMSCPDLIIAIDCSCNFRTADPGRTPWEDPGKRGGAGVHHSGIKSAATIKREWLGESERIRDFPDGQVHWKSWTERNGGAVMRGRTMARTRGVRAGPRAATDMTVPRTRRGHGGGGSSLIDTIPAAETLLFCYGQVYSKNWIRWIFDPLCSHDCRSFGYL